MKIKALSFAFLLVGILATLALVAGYSLCKSNNHPVISSNDFRYERVEIKHEDERITVAWVLNKGSERGFIFAHGNSSDRNSMIHRMNYFASLGYSVLALDLNAHGETRGNRKTFGYRESKDIETAVHYLRKKLGVKWVGGIGMSLGGASILKSVSSGGKFDAIIIESVFSNIRIAARNRLEIRFGKIGGLLEPLLTLQIPIWTGISRDELSPIVWAKKCLVPTLVLSGSLDSRAKPWEAKAIFDNLPTPLKRIKIIDGANHQDLFEFDSELYQKEIIGFLLSVEKKSVGP